MKPIDIVFVSWERPRITELAIRTIARNTKSKNYRLIVVDNGSDEYMQQALVELQDNGLIDELHLSSENFGLEPARNTGLDRVESEYFICADNDCLPEPMGDLDWIERLSMLMDNNRDYAAIACRTQVMIGSGNIFEDERKDITEFPHPGGSLRIMRTDLVREVGGWRNKVGGRGTEERYICGELHKLGYKTGFATHVNTLHLFGTPDTDNWGYDKRWKPEDTGHSSGVWHPVFNSGDDFEEVKKYAGQELAERYFHVERHTPPLG